MGWYERRVVPRRGEPDLRQPADGAASERALEARRRAPSSSSASVRAGTCRVYPSAVERVIAIDPSAVGRKLAAKRLAASRIPVDFAGLDGEQLPLEDNSVDNAVSTWTLCTIPDASAAVREVRRVLRPGGRFFFLEHGLSPDPKVARRQHRLNPLQGRIAGGCHLDRDITQIIEGAGFEIENGRTFYISGPKPLCYMYAGAARPT